MVVPLRSETISPACLSTLKCPDMVDRASSKCSAISPAERSPARRSRTIRRLVGSLSAWKTSLFITISLFRQLAKFIGRNKELPAQKTERWRKTRFPMKTRPVKTDKLKTRTCTKKSVRLHVSSCNALTRSRLFVLNSYSCCSRYLSRLMFWGCSKIQLETGAN